MTHDEAAGHVMRALDDYVSVEEQRRLLYRVKRTRTLAALVKQLPDEMQQVVALRCIERRDWADVAGSMYVTVRTAQRVLLRAVDRLAGALLAQEAVAMQEATAQAAIVG